MNNNKQKQFEKKYLLIEIDRLDKTLLKYGIDQKQKRRNICEDYFFDFCNFLDEEKICISDESAYLALSFPKKSTGSNLHESIFSLISDYYEKELKATTPDTTLPKQPPLAFWLILKPIKHSPIHISIFESTDDTMIISRIKQSIVGHLYFLGVIESVNDKAVYKNMDVASPLHNIHPSLIFSGSLGIQKNPQAKIIKRPDIDLKNISINDLMNVAKELLQSTSVRSTRR